MHHATAPLRPLLALAAVAALWCPAAAQDVDLDALEARLQAMERDMTELRRSIAEERSRREADAAQHAEETEALLDELDALRTGAAAGAAGSPLGMGAEDAWFRRLTLGGYGEQHFNFTEGEGGDQADLHRFVLYLGYAFDDWIQLNSEVELEHAFVNDDNGELLIEQLYFDFLLSPAVNVRAGRVLAPLGIINQRHEPPTFNGVERPSVERVVIPSTFSIDGAGLFGNITDELSYELYVTGGLDGSGFDDVDGIRGGRIEERPSLSEPAYSGRLDWFPLASSAGGADQDLRLGASFFRSGLDNGNKGVDSGAPGEVTILSGDFEYSLGDWDFRGVFATERIADARALNAFLADDSGIEPGIGKEIQGWYVEAGYHFLPDSLKTGRLEKADAVAFARYEDFDTQKKVSNDATRNPAADRDEVTMGLTFFLTPRFVVKVDYQLKDDDAPGDLPDAFNLGIGWSF